MSAWLQWLAVFIVLGGMHHAMSQDGESIFRQQVAILDLLYIAVSMSVSVQCMHSFSLSLH